MTPDGRFIAFVANTNGTSGTNTCVLVWDAQSGNSVLASGAPDNSVPPGSICDHPTLDPSGRYVAFLSTATNLTTNALSGLYHLFLRDLPGATTALVDADAGLAGAGVSAASVPRLAAGPVIAFESFKSDLAGTNANPTYDVFVRDLSAQTTSLISAHDPALPSLAADGLSLPGTWTLSSDNRYLAFSSDADNLVPNDTNRYRDIFVRDLLLGSTRRVSMAADGSAADGNSTEPSISGDGRFVAFTSGADNLVANDTNRLADVFVSDLQSGTTTLVSVSTNGVSAGNGASGSPVISADGRFVLFQSAAKNLVPGPYPYTSVANENLFLRDRQAQITYALTMGGVLAATMTSDGHYVAFAGSLDVYFPGSHLFVWDSWTASLVYTNTTSTAAISLGISRDGQRLALLDGSSWAALSGVDWATNRVWAINSGLRAASRPGLRFSGDGRFLTYAAGANSATANQVYLYDCQAETRLLVSQTSGGSGPANGNSDAPDISKDGSFVAFRSTATDLFPAATNGLPAIFLYDVTNNVTLLASASRFGNGTSDNLCLAPAFSGDGSVLVFGSWASNLAAHDFKDSADIFLLSPYATSVIPLFSLQAVVGAPGQGPSLTWPAMSGKSYQVQFRDSLTGSGWQDLPASPTIIGNQGYVNDSTAPGPQRFYRVVAF